MIIKDSEGEMTEGYSEIVGVPCNENGKTDERQYGDIFFGKQSPPPPPPIHFMHLNTNPLPLHAPPLHPQHTHTHTLMPLTHPHPLVPSSHFFYTPNCHV